MSVRSFESLILHEAREVLKVPKLRQADIMEWKSAELKPEMGERVFHLPRVGVWVAVKESALPKELIDTYLESINRKHAFDDAIELIREGRFKGAIQNIEAMKVEFDRLALVASELNLRIPIKGGGPKGSGGVRDENAKLRSFNYGRDM